MLLKIVRKTLTSRPGCLAAGAALMYLWDPDRGRSRRAELQQRGEAMLRRPLQKTAGEAMKQERHLLNRLDGAMAEARGGGRFHPKSDTDLREHLRQVVHSMHLPGEPVNVDVADGTVTLRGEVENEALRGHILASIGAVEGVARIDDYTHLPGQVAPNKASVFRDTTDGAG